MDTALNHILAADSPERVAASRLLSFFMMGVSIGMEMQSVKITLKEE
jgi:hypothetical protein